ncbi:MAG: dihydrofolate reductase [Holosporaceae bacterium]|nr:dihydrofolate reductase [Holosporaceae bacterium]
MIKLIAIVDKNFGISKNEKIPWSFKEDRIFFCRNTKFSTVVMGRRTFDSIDRNPLKNRLNCVLSRSVEHFGNSVEAFSLPEKLMDVHKDFWVIGGAEIFDYFLRNNLIDYALITKVHMDYCADKFINVSLLKQLEANVQQQTDSYTIYQYIKRPISTERSAGFPNAACAR